MGYLKSSNFVLGGTGWISFKLGGGKYPEFAYVSVHQSSDDKEIARFGNRFFNNTTRATTVYGSSISNAEAFLFPYYFNLSSSESPLVSLGTSLYIKLADTSAYDWSILSADSFVTYYASAPTPGTDDLAVNILPTIQGIDGASNAIVNGYFTDNADGWTVSGTGWGREGDVMKSNYANGDGGMGVVRSSAFNVSTNKYLRFSWGGGLKNDKRIFVSVKEVSTNYEVLRFVRRDNLSSSESNNLDNHMLNLSSLSASKLYYLEFADNISGGWGVSFIDEIRVVPKTEWDSVTSGDRAVLVSGSVQFALSFLEQTGPICAAMTGDFSSIWEGMGAHYSSLSNDAKNNFTNNDTTYAEIIAAQDRYILIINKYTSLTKFVVNSSNAQYLSSPDIIGYDFSDNSSIIIIVVIGLMVTSAGAFFIFSRRRKETA